MTEYCGDTEDLDSWCCCVCNPCSLCISSGEAEDGDD